MLTRHFIEKYLEHHPPNLQDIIRELRDIVVSLAPDATEEIRRNGLVYYYKQRGGPVSAGICQVLVQPDHVLLAFIHGAFLPDPENLLEGTEKYKRHVRIDSYEKAPWNALRDLIFASAHFDPRKISPADIAAIHPPS